MFVLCGAASAAAEQGAGVRASAPEPEAAAIPSDVRSYKTITEATDESLELPDAETRLALTFAEPTRAYGFDDGDGGGGGLKWLPVGLSLLVPGTGEIYLGYYWRGAALVTLEVLAWAGYIKWTQEGDDLETEYRAFADEHWAESKWIDDHNAWGHVGDTGPRTFARLDSIGRDFSYDGWPGYHSHTFKYENQINYYENIGKYDWFISGWSDWDPLLNPMETALRTEYKAMRKESDDKHDDAQKFIYLSLALRAFSVIETAILVNKDDKSEQAARPVQELRFKAKAKGLGGGELALEYKF